MKLLITGATGGIGRRIVDLAKNNYKINFLTTKKNKLNSIKSAKGFFWDPNKNFIDKKCFHTHFHCKKIIIILFNNI